MATRSTTSAGDHSRKEKLVDIQKREQLKGMLINKFKLKYGDKPNIAKFIDNEVAKYLKNDRLTEDTLRNLDSKIMKEVALRDKKAEISADRQSNASGRAASSSGLRKHNLDTLSNHSRASNRSLGRRQADGMSVASSQQDRMTEVYSEIAEEDEWTAIQKFNQLLHYEEQKQAMMREQERRRLMRQELDKQMVEKQNRNTANKNEEEVYFQLQQEHVKLLGMREAEKRDLARIKTQQEKESRDRQLNEEKRKRRHEEKANFRAEVELVDRLKNEMEGERGLQAEKREQERQYLKKMLVENEMNKAKVTADKQKEKAMDIQAQEEHIRMLDKQEQDRQREFIARERRAQEFMNNMAGNVIKNQAQKQRHEDEALNKYEQERELRLREEDRRRVAREKQEKDEMRALLTRQMQEKQVREQHAKAHNDEQAVLWARDKHNYESEENRLNQKIKQINSENASFLKQQVHEKSSKAAQKKMNRQEFQLNKPLLREIQMKRKTASEIDANSGVQEMDE